MPEKCCASLKKVNLTFQNFVLFLFTYALSHQQGWEHDGKITKKIKYSSLLSNQPGITLCTICFLPLNHFALFVSYASFVFCPYYPLHHLFPIPIVTLCTICYPFYPTAPFVSLPKFNYPLNYFFYTPIITHIIL